MFTKEDLRASSLELLPVCMHIAYPDSKPPALVRWRMHVSNGVFGVATFPFLVVISGHGHALKTW